MFLLVFNNDGNQQSSDHGGVLEQGRPSSNKHDLFRNKGASQEIFFSGKEKKIVLITMQQHCAQDTHVGAAEYVQ